MIPRVRRSLEGAGAPALLLDSSVKDVIADSIAEIILYTGGVFGKELIVTGVDGNGAPDEYATSEELTLPEQVVVSAQAALNHFFFLFAGSKISERIADEAQTWEWQRSANLLVEQLKHLIAARDKALEALAEDDTSGFDAYESFIAARDTRTSRIIEPWVGANGGGGLEMDYRFG